MEFVAKRAVNLPVSDLLNLEFHLMDTRPGVKLEAFVTELVQRWLAMDAERLALKRNGQAMRGFQWKNVFLPDGSRLRTSYHHSVEFARVVGDEILLEDGAAVTPSQFANRHAKGRNAWRFIWVRFPGEGYWVRAVDCRTRADEQLKRSKD
jgi:hypothetical protein